MKMRRGGGRGNGIPAPPTPVPPLVFLAFFTYHYLPLNLNAWNRLGIGFHGTRENQNPQGLFQVGETCRIKQPFFST